MDSSARQLDDAGGAAGTPNLIQRVIMVFMSPTRLGEVLRRQSPWFWTLAIVALFSLVMLLVPAEVWEASLEAQMRARDQGQGPDMETALKFARYGATVFGLVGTFVFAALIAGVLYLAFNVMLGAESTYKQHLSATAHIYWINTLGFLLLVPIWISRTDMQTQLGLGLLLPDAPSSFVGHFINSITIFGLWSSAALGAIESGLSGGRISIGKSIGVVLALYLVSAIVRGGLAGLGAG